MFGAIILIFLGLLFLGRNLGFVSWGFWPLFVRFWPIFLVAAGLEMLLGNIFAAKVVKLFLGLATIFVLIFMIVWWRNPRFLNLWTNRIGITLPLFPGSTQTVDLVSKKNVIDQTTFPGKSIALRDITLNLGSGIITLNDNPSKSYFEVLEQYPKMGVEPQFTRDLSGDTLAINLTDTNNHWLLGENKYDFGLGNLGTKTDFDLQLGAGKADLVFDNTPLDQVSFDLGAGFANISFSDNSLPAQPVPVEVGAGTANFKLPQDVRIKVTYDVGVGQLVINGTNVGNEGTYQSPDFDSASKKVEFVVDIGAGQVNFQQ